LEGRGSPRKIEPIANENPDLKETRTPSPWRQDEARGIEEILREEGDEESCEEGKSEVMKLSDLPPEEREEVIRMTKESHPDVELRDDTEFDYFLFPFPKDREVMAIDKAKAIWEAQVQQAASEWQAEPGVELADFISIVNRAFDRIPLEALRALNPEGRCLFRDEFENIVRGLL
jgi:hypothetical protein